MVRKRKKERIYVDPEFKKHFKSSASLSGMNLIEYSREMVDKGLIKPLPKERREKMSVFGKDGFKI